ncbi:FtsX-like permease family protein [Dactylosporangium sp. CA-233914]|uniref:FtsX-like permease family protein n=1 Tax=Dactylosporangium sp. CA-233914 TaxID=3239934 RepID=UPI003D8B9C1F
MIRLVWRQIRRRWRRSAAQVLAVAAAATTFTVLTGHLDAERLEVRDTVEAGSRGPYDILIRSAGDGSADDGLVRPDPLGDGTGGISQAQYRAVRSVAGVEVAAPIAVVGYVLLPVSVPVPVPAGPSGRELYVADVAHTTDRGLSRFDEPAASYTYVTGDRVELRAPDNSPGPFGAVEVGADGRGTLVCPEPAASADPFAAAARRTGTCWSRVSGPVGGGWTAPPGDQVAVQVRWSVPMLVAAVDPAAEAALAGVDRAMSSGSFLPQDGAEPGGPIPMLLADRLQLDDSDQVSVRRLPAEAADRLAAGLDPAQVGELLDPARPGGGGAVVVRRTVTADEAYQHLLAQRTTGPPTVVDCYWTPGPAPRAVTNPPDIWRSQLRAGGVVPAPPDAADTALRTLTPHVAAASGPAASGAAPRLRAVGAFDPTRIGTDPVLGTDPGRPAALLGYGTSAPRGADPASDALLGGRPLLPNANPAGYPPAPITALIALHDVDAFTDPGAFTGTHPAAPISAIRVRVAGAAGGQVGRERVRVVADAIARATGLSVEVVRGASLAARTVELPAGTHGRPPLRLTEMWLRNGVATSIVTASDRESLILFVLVLVVCALFVANATTAATHGRRQDAGLLSALGWSPARVAAFLVADAALLALIAGGLAAGLSFAIDAGQGTGPTALRIGVVAPTAALVSALVVLPTAWRATRPGPAAAAPGPSRRRARTRLRAAGVTGLALANLVRVPRRSLVAALGVAVGCAALTVALSVRWAFHGALVGSVLGEAVSVEARAVDYVAVVATLLMSAVAVADVGYLNLADRRPEIAVAVAVGWRTGTLVRLFAIEAAVLGLAGALAGTAVGLGLAATLSGAVPPALVAVGAVAVAGGTALTALATLVPLWLAGRPDVTGILASES